MAAVTTVNELLDGHVSLDIECMDRIYLNGYVPNLQVGGQVVSFMTAHLKQPIPSPAIMEKMGTRFRRAVSAFAETDHIPVVHFSKGDRKIDMMRRYLAAQELTGRSGVAAIGVAQEYQNVFAANQRQGSNGVPWFSFTKADRRVSCFYFYLWDVDFGAAFVKVCAYFPYPIKVWVNGHEWAKRQCVQAGVGFTALSNGFASCEDPARLQAICDRLGAGPINVFFQRWMSVLPLPLTDHDRDAGYWWELSMRQIEVSRTMVFDAPRRARGFFEALVTDNLDLGRPDSMELIFTGHRVHRGRPVTIEQVYKTKVLTRDTEVTINAFFNLDPPSEFGGLSCHNFWVPWSGFGIGGSRHRPVCPAFPLGPLVVPVGAGWSGCCGGGWPGGDGVEELLPPGFPGPVPGQVQGRAAPGGGDTGRDADQVRTQRRGGGLGVQPAGQRPGGAGEVERHHRALQPGGVGLKMT